MLDQTLKTIEIVNINDMAQEKDQLQFSCDNLWNKKSELDKIEEELQREKGKRDFRKTGGKGNSLKKQQTIAASKAFKGDDSPIMSDDSPLKIKSPTV